MIVPKIITFSGIDGSGKTTIAHSLEKYLKEKEYRVKLYHIGGSFASPSEPKRPISPFVGFSVFLNDYIEIILRFLSSVGTMDVVIFDRFLYDSVVKVAYKQGTTNISPFYTFLISTLSQHATSFLLITTPTRSFLRDKEHSKDYHIKKHMLYHKLLQSYPLIIIDSTRPVSDVFEETLSKTKI